MVVYDNPGTTHFTFSLELYAQIAQLPGIASLKIRPMAPETAGERVAAVRAVLPEHVTLGISGDACAAAALLAGCDGWYSVIAGTCPQPALEIMRAAVGPQPLLGLGPKQRERTAEAVAELGLR